MYGKMGIKMPGHMFALQSVRENDKIHLFRMIFIGYPGKIGSALARQRWS
jgi:hypothetical protein